MSRLAAALLALALMQTQGGPPAPQLPREKFPAKVTSVGGKVIDVARLAQGQRVVVVTLKATWCRVCQEQLRRIKDQLSLSRCGATFLVLSPGPKEELRKIQERTGFPFPFVEDRGLAIARSLGLQLSEAEIQPAILILRKDRSVGWIQWGRGPTYYGDRELLEELDCAGLIWSTVQELMVEPHAI